MADKWLANHDSQKNVILRPLSESEIRTHILKQPTLSAELSSGVILDFETTGLSWEQDKVIELGLWYFSYDRTRKAIVSLHNLESHYQDIEGNVPEQVTLLTGITKKDLAGRKIDWASIGKSLSTISLIVAHNARFDRPFFDHLYKDPLPIVWSCSMSQIDWIRRGFPGTNLELLTHRHGCFYSSHNAASDVMAVMNLLTFPDAGVSYFGELLENAYQPQIDVLFLNTNHRDAMKFRQLGFRWSYRNKTWRRNYTHARFLLEKEKLLELAIELKAVVNFKELPVTQNFSSPFKNR